MATSPRVSRRILVFGATGVIGQHLIQQLYEAKQSFDKIGIFTSLSSAEKKSEEFNSWKAKGVDVIAGDVNSESDVTKAYEGQLCDLAFMLDIER